MSESYDPNILREQGNALIQEGCCKINKGQRLLAIASTIEAMKGEGETNDLPITSQNGHTNAQNGHTTPDYSKAVTGVDKLIEFMRVQTQPLTSSEIKRGCTVVPANTIGAYLYTNKAFKRKDGKFVLAK